MPSASNINGLDCQTSLKARFDTQRVFPALSNHIIERDDGRYQIGAVRMTARSQAISVANLTTPTTKSTHAALVKATYPAASKPYWSPTY